MEGAVTLSLHEAIMMQLDEVRDLRPALYSRCTTTGKLALETLTALL